MAESYSPDEGTQREYDGFNGINLNLKACNWHS
jgi:hypothetical protein